MLYIDFQNKVAKLGYRAELDRIKDGFNYVQKNRVHVFDETNPVEIAKIFEFDAAPMIDDNVESALVDLINKFASTPINERGIQDEMPQANIRK